jgi:hypothetical protein
MNFKEAGTDLKNQFISTAHTSKVIKWGTSLRRTNLTDMIKPSFVPRGYKLVPIQNHLNLKVEYEQEEDGRVIADVTSVPGALAWDEDKQKAALKALAIAFEIILDEVAHNERAVASLGNIQVDGLE